MTMMLERIARAICEQSGIGWESVGPDYREICEGFALAAVKAMREPDDAMKDAGMDAIDHLDAWASMIDSILATQPQEQER